jgi:hypothetical protein
MWRLRPYERFLLPICKDVREMLVVLRASRYEVENPDTVKNVRFSLRGIVCFIFLVGVRRHPFFYIVGPLLAFGCYVAIAASLIKKLFV